MRDHFYVPPFRKDERSLAEAKVRYRGVVGAVRATLTRSHRRADQPLYQRAAGVEDVDEALTCGHDRGITCDRLSRIRHIQPRGAAGTIAHRLDRERCVV
jgi:hypothetical protein